MSNKHLQDSLLRKPKPPDDSDCCGSGCTPCVFDIYEQELKIWERECLQIHQKNSQHSGNVLSELEYRKFIITQVSQETADTFRFQVKLPEFSNLGLQIGQHIIIRDFLNDNAITRQYTPVSHVDCVGYFELLIKVYEGGSMSRCVKQWKAGTSIDVRGPFGYLDYKPNKFKKMLIIAAGTGIAPMSQIIKGILGNESDDTVIQMFYACRTYKSILMKAELDEWASFWNFSVIYALSQEPENGVKYKYNERINKGRIDLEFLSRNITESDTASQNIVLICGTRSFDTLMIENCKQLNFTASQIHKF